LRRLPSSGQTQIATTVLPLPEAGKEGEKSTCA
jgi:hypothetical protein